VAWKYEFGEISPNRACQQDNEFLIYPVDGGMPALTIFAGETMRLSLFTLNPKIGPLRGMVKALSICPVLMAGRILRDWCYSLIFMVMILRTEQMGGACLCRRQVRFTDIVVTPWHVCFVDAGCQMIRKHVGGCVVFVLGWP